MTEKQYAPLSKDKRMSKEKMKLPADAPVPKIKEKAEEKKISEETKTEEAVKTKDEKKAEINKKHPVKKIKKDYAVVNANNARVSTKYSVEICRFIKNKRIGDAIRDLEQVVVKRKSIPMRGEYAHRKGPGKLASGAGKYPVNAAKEFIVLLKSLLGNANDMNEPYVAEASANKAPSPRGRFGRWERKRSHIKLVAKEMKIRENKTKEEVK